MSNKKYRSVAELVRDTFDDESLSSEFEERLRVRTVVKQLVALRAARGMSQSQVADRLGCSQSRVSKLEAGVDSDLRLSDLSGYCSAVGLRVGLVFADEDQSLVDQVKAHALKIHSLLRELATLAHKDDHIAEGVAAFLNEAFFNLLQMLQDSANQMPASADGKPLIRIEMIDPKVLEADSDGSLDNIADINQQGLSRGEAQC